MTDIEEPRCHLLTDSNMAKLPLALRKDANVSLAFSNTWRRLMSAVMRRSVSELRKLNLPVDRAKRNVSSEIGFDGLRCAVMLDEWADGLYHLNKLHLYPWHLSWTYVNYDLSLSTTDSDELTKLVLLAHKHAIRVAIAPKSSRNISIIMHPRTEATDAKSDWATTHPNIAALAKKMDEYVV